MYFRIELTEKVEKELLEKIQAEHKEKRENISDLYSNLITQSKCESHSEGRATYVSNTLQTNNIKFIFKRID